MFSQNTVALRGIVSDSDTGKAIEYATVQLLAMPDSTLVSGVVTDKDGSFSLHLSRSGSYCVVASFIGYNSLYKRIDYKTLPTKIKETIVLNIRQYKKSYNSHTLLLHISCAYHLVAFRLPESSQW